MKGGGCVKLFCYGTLQVPEVWRRVAGRVPPGEAAVLAGHVGRRIAGEVFPAAVRRREGVLSGTLYHDVSPRQMRKLDAFEGAWYRRVRVDVLTDARRRVRTWVYLLRSTQRFRLEQNEWDIDGFLSRDLAAYLARIGRAPSK